MNTLRHAAVVGVFCVAFFAGGAAQAAGIDCTLAKSTTERLVCGDKAIESLDDTLSDEYTATMAVAADQNALAQSQRDWLKQRNACSDGACVKAAYQARIASLPKVPHAGWQTYHDAKLGISFDYLANRHVVSCSQDPGAACVALTGRGMAPSDYFITFKVVNKPLEQAAAEDVDFVKQGGKWVTQDGPGEPQVVQSFSGKGWTGLKATISCGISDSNGFHAGAGDCFWSAISNGKRSVVSDTQGIVGTDADTMRSLNSLHFDR